jgi:hypothetical protein
MANKWMTHVKKTMKKMSSKKKSLGKGWFKTVLKEAKSTYHKKGGADEPEVKEEKEEKEDSVKETPELEQEGGKRKRRGHHTKTQKRRRHH